VLFVDEQSVATTDEPHYRFGDLRCGTSYTLGVEAFDSSGDRSERTSVVGPTSPCPDAPPPPVPAPSPAPSPPPPRPTPTPPASSLTSSPQISVEPESSSPPASGDTPTIVDTAPGPALPMSWNAAGAFIWHETTLDPALLGRELRENGFGWIAIQIHDGTSVDPLDLNWVRQFRAASGLPVGGWGVLRTDPEQEATLAHALVTRDQLDFYIANAEAEYKFSGDDDESPERYGRSRRFVDEFRALSPDLPAAVVSYCRADRANVDWHAWSLAGFSYLPEAYANDLGDAASPAACMTGATGFFSLDHVHPVIGMYLGQQGRMSPDEYTTDLAAAQVVGFSVYLADNKMNASDWSTLGNAIRTLGIARTDSAPHVESASAGDADSALPPIPRLGASGY
jgi:hypothetical protein